MGVGSRLLQARKHKDLNQRELGEMIGVTAATISDWERGKANPDVEKLSQLMKILNVDANYFYQDMIGNKAGLSDEETSLVADYRELNMFNQEIVSLMIQALLDRQFAVSLVPGADGELEIPRKSIPMYFEMTSAGKGNLLFDQPAPANIEIIEDRPAKRADFVLQIDGDSMEPKLMNRDLVLVKRQPLVEDGDIGIFMVDGKSYVKERRGQTLHSANPKYPDIPMSIDTVCFGKVLGKARI